MRAPLLLVLATLVASCAEQPGAPQQISSETPAILCSVSVDDLVYEVRWDEIELTLQRARDDGTVAVLHAHDPGRTISTDAIERVLGLADAAGLGYVTYAELAHVTGPALAFAFDDQWLDSWIAIAPQLAAHAARVTFFVTRVHTYDAQMLDELARLAAAGHGVEAHSVNHLHARDYEAVHGVAGYVADEVMPSIEILEHLGYPVTSYAFPFGESDDALDAAVLEHVPRVRVSPGSCPY